MMEVIEDSKKNKLQELKIVKDIKDDKGKKSWERNDDGESEDQKNREEVELELEEGEISDKEDAKPKQIEPRPIIQFFCCGQCTCGVSGRFSDPGNYTMFDMVRPMAYSPHATPPREFRPHVERPSLVGPLSGYSAHDHAPQPDDYPSESVWERELRYAYEMMLMEGEQICREARYYFENASVEPPNDDYYAHDGYCSPSKYYRQDQSTSSRRSRRSRSSFSGYSDSSRSSSSRSSSRSSHSTYDSLSSQRAPSPSARPQGYGSSNDSSDASSLSASSTDFAKPDRSASIASRKRRLNVSPPVDNRAVKKFCYRDDLLKEYEAFEIAIGIKPS